jgi:uncharacterized protein (DUF2267 family)
MAATGLTAIDRAVHLTHEWLNDLMGQLGWEDKQRAYRLLRVTLQTLRDWLGVNEASHLGAQLPILIRGIYYEGWRPAGTPVTERSKTDFLARIDKAFETDPIDDVEEAVTDVFKVLNHHVSAGEVEDVRHALPKGLRELWPE